MATAVTFDLVSGPDDDPAPVELVFRPDFRDDSLSASELEILGSVLPELIGELLQMTEDQDRE